MAEGGGALDQPVPVLRLTHPHPLRKWYAMVLAAWLVIAVALWGHLAQDATPYLVAGDLVHQPHQIYGYSGGEFFQLQPGFAHQYCRLAPAGTDCSAVETGFMAMPLTLPMARAVAAAGPGWGILVMRLLAAGSLVLGMVILWNRLAGRGPRAPALLLATAVLLTPMAMVPIVLGQTSPYLFLAAVLGVRRTDGRTGWAWLVSGLWALAIGLKVFPAVLGLVLLRQRRLRLCVMAAAVLVGLGLITLVWSPVVLWRDFVHIGGQMSAHSLSNPYNGSLDELANHLWHPLVSGEWGPRLLWVVRAGGALALWWWAVGDADDDSQWAYGWLVALFISPLVWWHYLWLAVAAAGVVLARPQIDRRALVLLPVMAAVSVPLSVVNSRSTAWPVPQALFLVVAAVAVAAVSRRARTQAGTAVRS